MGLDMFLDKKVYIGANYIHNKIEGVIQLKKNGKEIKIDLKKVTYIIERVGYWRKPNAIHKWFVDNIQDGLDDCKEYEVSYEKLLELKKLCEKVLNNKDSNELQPHEGFFFGSTEKDEYYYQDLKDTIEIIESLKENEEYYYCSSW